MNITLNKNDEVVMKLLHYFITVEGYNPVILHGAKDEIWLENNSPTSEYKIVRIVSNYIHNDEQLNFDLFRTKQILKKIRFKMFTFKIETLSIFVNLGDSVKLDNKDFDNIRCAKINNMEDINKYSFILNTFPNILQIEYTNKEGMELFIKLTEDINKKNIEESKKAEDVFSKKKPIMTYVFIGICVLLYLISAILSKSVFNMNANVLYKMGALVSRDYMNYDIYRLIASIFLHSNIFHLACNMYSLYVIGPQLESFYGKIKFSIIFILSGIIGNLLSMALLSGNYISVGASGAIFGLFGALLYFGYHYRIYLSGIMRSQVIPLIVLNLFIGFSISGINNFAHIGGLIGGVIISKAVGVKYKSKKSDIINGIILSLIFIIFLIYLAFFR